MVTSQGGRESQQNKYFGLNGREVLDGGDRGTVTIASGVLFGTDLATYNANELAFRNFVNGGSYTLVDTMGRTWKYVRMIGFRPGGDKAMVSTNGVYFRPYEAEFEHLATSVT